MSIPSSRIRENLHALSAPENQSKTLPIIEPVGAIAARRGVAAFESSSSGGSGGIASPLVETAFSDRTYHANKYIFSGDFLMGMEIRAVKDIVMKDDNQASVVLTFKEPIY